MTSIDFIKNKFLYVVYHDKQSESKRTLRDKKKLLSLSHIIEALKVLYYKLYYIKVNVTYGHKGRKSHVDLIHL
jgi:hypothetical protein